MPRIFFLCFVMVGLYACSNADRNMDSQSPINTTVQPTTVTQSNLAAIPDSITQIDTFTQIDTTKKIEKPKRLPAKAQFAATNLSYGTITQGTIKELIFKFKNVGEMPLEIKDVQGSCGCTIGSFSFLPIRPGESSEIKARFDSKNKMGNQRNTLTVTTNGDPSIYILNIEGIVTEASKDSLK